MALRDQPYLPLYVQDFMTDEKLSECSALATGVYIRLMCLMHKSEEYGCVLLKQKDKQSDKQILNFACKVAKNMPYDINTIESALAELIEESVLTIDGDMLVQKRMVKDCKLSEKRAFAGKNGGIKSSKKEDFAQAKGEANTEAKVEANSEYESEDEIEDENVNSFRKGGMGENPYSPTFKQVEVYFSLKELGESDARRFFDHYEAVGWFVNGQPIRKWQPKADQWIRDDNGFSAKAKKQKTESGSARSKLAEMKKNVDQGGDNFLKKILPNEQTVPSLESPTVYE